MKASEHMIIDKRKEKPAWGRTCIFGDISQCKKYIFVHGHWSPTPKDGDLVITEVESGRIAEFEFFDVKCPGNPTDQYFAKAYLRGYLDESE